LDSSCPGLLVCMRVECRALSFSVHSMQFCGNGTSLCAPGSPLSAELMLWHRCPPSTEGLIYNHVGHQPQSTFSNQYVPQQAPRCRIIRVSAVMGASLVEEIKKNVMLTCPMSVTQYKDWTHMFEFRKTINKLSRRTDLVVTNKRNHQRQAKKRSQQIGDGG